MKYPKTRRMTDPKERLLRHVIKQPNGCWIWTGKKAGRYGMMSYGSPKKLTYAHRVSYLIHKGEIPDGMNVCHTCDTPLCVNPDHLFHGTQKENLTDASKKGRTARGESHGRVVLTEAQVLDIRRRRKTASAIALASEFGVSPSHIRDILTGKKWSHLK